MGAGGTRLNKEEAARPRERSAVPKPSPLWAQRNRSQNWAGSEIPCLREQDGTRLQRARVEATGGLLMRRWTVSTGVPPRGGAAQGAEGPASGIRQVQEKQEIKLRPRRWDALGILHFPPPGNNLDSQVNPPCA